MRLLVIASLVVGGLSGCGPRSGCSKNAPRGATLLTSPGDSAFQRVAPDTFIAQFQTSRGNFFVQVARAWAPRGADRFYNLVRRGFYDGNRFYRVVDGFVVQWGASGDPAVNRAWARQCIHDDPVKRPNIRRAVTFAFGQPNTRTTQVFINFGVNWRLDQSGFAPFGEVIEGMEVVDSLYNGYGDGPPRGNGPDAGRVSREGNAYLAREFPKLDSIVHARIVAESGKKKP
jgi:cyclophilin family peptidyl-prolyl cis-trans isomerase